MLADIINSRRTHINCILCSNIHSFAKRNKSVYTLDTRSGISLDITQNSKVKISRKLLEKSKKEEEEDEEVEKFTENRKKEIN